MECKTGHCLIKRKGHQEDYDEKKVYASCFFSCKSVNIKEKNCEDIAKTVTKEVTKWVKKQKGVTSDMIFERIKIELEKHDKDAAYMYATHRDVN